MTIFYLVRHGKHDYDSVKNKNFIGHGLELAHLTEEGIVQAEELSNDSRLRDCDIIISSPYTRAMHTSAILSKNLGLDIRVETDLREHELDLTYSYRSFDDLRKIIFEERKRNGEASDNDKYVWETRNELRERVINVLKKYDSYEKVIAVCHGMVIHCLTGKTGIPNCSVHEFKLKDI